jgi:hypothetical protein
MDASRHDRAKSHRRDQHIERATPERESADSRERLRKLRLMLGEVSEADGRLSSQPAPRSRYSPDS